jgi:hypothetical protein
MRGVLISLACWQLLSSALCYAQPATPPSEEARQQAERAQRLLQQLDAQQVPINSEPTKLGQVRTKLFGIPAEGAKFVYVMDRSASMSEPKNLPLNAAKHELQQSLQPLGRVHQFYLVFYNQEPRIFQPAGDAGKLLFGTDQNKEAANRFINAIAAEGGTEHYAALTLALKMRPDVIFFLTDGDAADDLTADQLESLEKQNSGQSQIHVVQFASGQPTGERIKKLAQQNRGEFKEIDVRELK